MIKLSYDIKKYRQDLLDLVKADDIVIELGCHVGGTTKLISDICHIVAVDNSPEAVDIMNNMDNVDFISGDVRLHEVLAQAFEKVQKCDVLAIDLGGGYHPDTAFKVFYIWSSTFKPTHTVIRNRGYWNLLIPLRAAERNTVPVKVIWSHMMIREFLL